MPANSVFESQVSLLAHKWSHVQLRVWNAEMIVVSGRVERFSRGARTEDKRRGNDQPLSPFMITHIRDPTHLSISSAEKSESPIAEMNLDIQGGLPRGRSWEAITSSITEDRDGAQQDS